MSIIEQSQKTYKLYIHQPDVPNAFGGIKYYRHHNTPEFIKELSIK